MTVRRPAPPFDHGELDPRYEWRAVVDDDWSTNPDLIVGKRCRWTSAGVGRCPNAAEAALWRPVWRSDRPKRPWAYCGAHLYGRWLEDGHVMTWHAVRAD